MTGTGTSGTINGESNLQFDGSRLVVTGTERIIDGTSTASPSLQIDTLTTSIDPSESIVITNLGDNSTTTTRTGISGTVTRGTLSNTGVYMDVTNSRGYNLGFSVLNSSDEINSRQTGYYGLIDGGASGMNKTGISLEVVNLGQNNIGAYTYVSDATKSNIGFQTGVVGTSGFGIGILVEHSLASTGDSEYGGRIIVNGAGASDTVKYGLYSEVSHSAQINYGLYTNVSGATENYSMYLNQGKWTAYHDPTAELGVNDPEGYGDIVYFGGGTGFTAGNVMYLDSSGNWNDADASATASSINMLAMALGTDATAGMLVRGYAYMSTWGFTVGYPLFLKTTAGQMTNAAPTSSGQVVRVVGYAIDAGSGKKIYFNPSQDWVEI